jgi:hypothetical protein
MSIVNPESFNTPPSPASKSSDSISLVYDIDVRTGRTPTCVECIKPKLTSRPPLMNGRMDMPPHPR